MKKLETCDDVTLYVACKKTNTRLTITRVLNKYC